MVGYVENLYAYGHHSDCRVTAHNATYPWFCAQHMAGVDTTRGMRGTFQLTMPHIHDVVHTTWLE